MPKHTVSCSAKCPYYKAHGGHEIYCRGPKEDTSIHVAFAVPAEKKVWMDQYCKTVKGCRDCPVRKMLEDAGM